MFSTQGVFQTNSFYPPGHNGYTVNGAEVQAESPAWIDSGLVRQVINPRYSDYYPYPYLDIVTGAVAGVTVSNVVIGDYGDPVLESVFDVEYDSTALGKAFFYVVRSNDPNIYPGTQSYVWGTFNIPCMVAKLDSTRNVTTQVITATATYEGGTAPFTYAFTLPADATDVSGTGSTRQFKSVGGGDVSVTITDSATPTPCSDTATEHICGLGLSLDLSGGASGETGFAAQVQAYPGVAPYSASWSFPPNATNITSDTQLINGGSNYFANAQFDYPKSSEPQEVAVSVTVTDSANPPCSHTISATGTSYPTEPPPGGCPAGTHDDGAGQCVPDGTDPTGPQPCAAGYHDDGTGVCVIDPTDPTEPKSCAAGYTWDGSACVPTTPPPTGSCTIDCSFKSTDKGGNLYRIEAQPSGVQNPPVAATWKRDGVALAATALFVEQTIEPNAEAVFAVTLTDGACVVTRSHVQRNEDGGTTGPVEPPIDPTLGAPGAPVIARDCEAGTLLVTPPAFPANAVSLELQRDDAEAIIHTFAAADAWPDANTREFEPTLYRCRSVDAEGARSDWGPYSEAKSRASDALAITWLVPAADGDELSGRVTLRVQLTDGGETLDACDNPQLPDGACPSLDVADAQLAFRMDGLPLTATQIAVARFEGTPRNGVYEVSFDSRLFLSGTRALEATARGSDCCRARASREVEVSNTFDQGVRWFEVSTPVSETNAYVSLQNEPLYPHPLRRYFVQSVVCDQTSTRVAWLDPTIGEDDKNTAFDALLERRAFSLSRAGSGVTPEQTQWRGKAALKPGATALFWVQRWTPMQHLGAFNTLETDVVSLSPTGEDEQIAVFSRSGAATGETARARLAIYDDGTLTQKFDLTARGLGSARAVAWMSEHRAVYIVAGSGNSAGFYVLDLDAGQARYHVTLDDETRFPRFVARTGEGETAKVWLVLVNGALNEKRTAVYNYSPGAIEPRAELDEPATFVAEAGGKLYVGCEGKLFCIEGSAATLIREFSAPISAVSALMEGTETKLLIGFENGLVRDGDAEVLVALNGPVGALTTWAARDGEPDRAVAGGDGAKLTEQLEGGSWSDARDLPIPALEVVEMGIDRVTALRAVSRVTRAASGEPGQPGFIAEKRERELLIGTATEGAGQRAPVMVLRLAPPERIKGSFLSSRISRPAFEARAV